jgi:hypothetical protein
LSQSSKNYGFGIRVQGSKRHRIPDPDPQHWLKVFLTVSVYNCFLLFFSPQVNNAKREVTTVQKELAQISKHISQFEVRKCLRKTFKFRIFFRVLYPDLARLVLALKMVGIIVLMKKANNV